MGRIWVTPVFVLLLVCQLSVAQDASDTEVAEPTAVETPEADGDAEAAVEGESEAAEEDVEPVAVEESDSDVIDEADETGEVDAVGDQPQELRGRIVAVQGLVQVRLTEDAAWQPAKAGLAVNQGSEFRTGPRSAVRFVLEGGHVITLDRLGTMKVITAVRQADGKIKTDMGMKYGRTSYEIQTGGEEHQSSIRSPGATLAVRGSHMVVQSDAMGTWHKMLESTALSNIYGTVSQVEQGNETTDRDSDPADFKWHEILNNPEGFFGKTDADDRLARLMQALGGDQISRLDPRSRRQLREVVRQINFGGGGGGPGTIFGDFVTSFSKLSFEVFDSGAIDMDIVDVEFNGVILDTNLVLDNPGDVFMVNLNPGINQFTLIGRSPGTSGPLTGAVEVIEEGQTFFFSMTGDGDRSSIEANFVPGGIGIEE